MVWSEASMGWLRVCPTRFEDSLIPWRSLSWSMRRQTSQRKSDRLSAPKLTHLGQVTFSALGQDRRKRTRNFNCSTRQVWLLSNHISCLMSAAAAAKSLQSCRTLCDPRDGSPPGSPSLGFSRQEHWSGLPFPSPMHESEKWKRSHPVMSDSSRPHGLQPTRLLRPWDFPSKSTGVGCHCLLLLHANTCNYI